MEGRRKTNDAETLLGKSSVTSSKNMTDGNDDKKHQLNFFEMVKRVKEVVLFCNKLLIYAVNVM